MAKSKNKNNELTYLQIPTVNSKRKTRRVKVNWSGLNYRQTMDSGVLSYEQNISTDEAPYLTPCEQYSILPIAHNAENIGMIYGWNELLIAVFYDEVSTAGNIQPRIYIYDNTGKNLINTNHKQYLQLTGEIVWTDLSKINISSFKFAGNKEDTVEGNAMLFFPIGSSLKQKPIKDIIYTYERNSSTNDIKPWSFTKLFIDRDVIYNVLPNPKRPVPLKDDLDNKNYANYNDIYKLTNDKKYNETLIYGRWEYNTSNHYWISSGFQEDEAEDGSVIYSKEIIFPTPQSFTTKENPIPPGITSSTVFQSRVFGINKNKVYASGFADYANWELDTADNISAEHAWESTLSANPEADGELTAITAYQDRVVVFRENYMYEIRSTKNPFRVVDIFNEGCINPNGYAVVNGMLLFASKYGLRMYTGARPKDIGYELNINQIHYACTGTDGIRWYVYCQTDKKEHNMFVYNTVTGLWSETAIDKKIISFAKTNSSALFMLDDNNTIYRVDSGDYANTEWIAETDFYSGSNINIKHIKKIQMLAEIAPGSTVNVHLLCDDENFDNLTDEEKAERLLYSKTNDIPSEGTPDTPSEGTPTKATTKTFPIRFVPRKTANYRYKIRLSGKGYSKIYQMEVITTDGGELFNGE